MAIQWDLLLRVIVGTALGAIIGYERNLHGRPAGLRTHMIVALASATFMVISSHFVYFQHYGPGDLVTVDPSRIAASVVTGIGFLGGGAILRIGASVQGLTTAAGLWLVAAIGMAAGAGMYAISALATLLGIAALSVMRRFERKDDAATRRRVSIVLTEGAPPISALLAALGERGVRATPTDYEKRFAERRVQVTLDVRMPAGEADGLLDMIESQPGVERVRIESVL